MSFLAKKSQQRRACHAMPPSLPAVPACITILQKKKVLTFLLYRAPPQSPQSAHTRLSAMHSHQRCRTDCKRARDMNPQTDMIQRRRLTMNLLFFFLWARKSASLINLSLFPKDENTTTFLVRLSVAQNSFMADDGADIRLSISPIIMIATLRCLPLVPSLCEVNLFIISPSSSSSSSSSSCHQSTPHTITYTLSMMHHQHPHALFLLQTRHLPPFFSFDISPEPNRTNVTSNTAPSASPSSTFPTISTLHTK
ncbi:hypothetical protein B0T10DRAFT_209081 [Thelonectria olida]|uniref:Uncharacterized protein n=1 Tax=Thelonectria olida TaxID=1576542 RepID=A0A9P8WDN6_9HYPO|nr:hypothetical protein B0T10DRAFT_209081 [Thelonectria olida]